MLPPTCRTRHWPRQNQWKDGLREDKKSKTLQKALQTYRQTRVNLGVALLVEKKNRLLIVS